MNEKITRKTLLAIDVETNGLFGEVLAVGAVVYRTHPYSGYLLIDSYCKRIDNLPEPFDPWIEHELYPKICEIEDTFDNKAELLIDFKKFYNLHTKKTSSNNDTKIISHMNYICEARFIKELNEVGLMTRQESPFPILDISASLDSLDELSTSVDYYLEKYSDQINRNYFGGEHNPLQDADDIAQAYIHSKQNFRAVLLNPNVSPPNFIQKLFCRHRYLTKIEKIPTHKLQFSSGKSGLYRCVTCQKTFFM